MTGAEMVRVARARSGLTLRAFSKFTGVSLSHLTAIEHNRRSLTETQAAALARVLKESEVLWVEVAINDRLRACNLKMHASVQTREEETLCTCGHTDGYHSLSGICRCCNCHTFKAV